MEIVLDARLVDAAQAEARNWATRAVPDDERDTVADDLARAIVRL